jgi:serine/threonine-protein kinase
VDALKICPTCSAEYPATEKFCPKDGTGLRAQSGGDADLVGSIIAERYHVLEKLGEGGMGQVYLAEHVKMGRRSAIKVLRPAMVHDAAAIGRFNREAANASRIDHPNVAGIYDFGETADGLVYLAMQYIEGQTLTQIAQTGGALPLARAAEITRQAAEGLHAAHALGIVHRDLKPDNIMVAVDRDGIDCVKVVDFGIAKSAGATGQKVTRTGMVVGTPEYMSPEQLAGDEVDGRSDQYSLALVAFNLLTGDLPFPSESTQTSMVMRLSEPPKSLAAMNPHVAWTPEVEAVMHKALSREPARRYENAREFGRALHAAIEQMPLSASGITATTPLSTVGGERTAPVTTPAARAAAAPKRRELMIAAGVAGAVVVIVVAVLIVRSGAASGDASSATMAQGISAYREGRRAAATENFLAAGKEAPADPMPHVYLARMAREANNLVAANEEAVKAVQLGPSTGVALRELASTLFAQQNYTGARTFYTRAIKADASDRSSQGFLGCSLIRLGRADEGARWLQRAGSGPWSGCAAGVAPAP